MHFRSRAMRAILWAGLVIRLALPRSRSWEALRKMAGSTSASHARSRTFLAGMGVPSPRRAFRSCLVMAWYSAISNSLVPWDRPLSSCWGRVSNASRASAMRWPGVARLRGSSSRQSWSIFCDRAVSIRAPVMGSNRPYRMVMPSSGSVLTLAYRRDRWCSSLDMPSSWERCCSCLRTVPANLSGDWVRAASPSSFSSISPRFDAPAMIRAFS